jgi:hypothetical protein
MKGDKSKLFIVFFGMAIFCVDKESNYANVF